MDAKVVLKEVTGKNNGCEGSLKANYLFFSHGWLVLNDLQFFGAFKEMYSCFWVSFSP